MNEEQTRQFNEMIRTVSDLSDTVRTLTQFMESKKQHQITFPVDDASRITMGVGFIGKDATTTPAGAVLVNTNEGIKKFLIAA